MRKFIFKWRGGIMAILALVVIVKASPTVASLKLGLSIAALGELLRLYALGYSGEHTRSSKTCAPMLITAGPFAHCRNPLYLGNILNALGATVAAIGGLCWLEQLGMIVFCALGLFVVYGSCISVEEDFLEKQFGDKYRRYCTITPRMLPVFVAPMENNRGKFEWKNLKFEATTIMWYGFMAVYLCCRCKW